MFEEDAIMKRVPHHWINWSEIILDDRDLPFHSKALALFLSTYMNASHDMTYPSISTIRGRMGLGSNSTAIKYLAVLEEKGYLMTERRYGNSKIYTAVIPTDHPSITPPVVLHEVEHSITPRGLTVLHHVEPNKQENNQLNKQETLHTSKPMVSTGNGEVPFSVIINKWNDFADKQSLPKVVKVTTALKGQIRQRWKDIPKIENWDNFFDAIGQNDFLTGRAPPGYGRNKPFRSTLAWVTKESNFAKIAAGEYD